jgi:DNA-directed RNA polymerase subunit K/omega
MTVDSFMKMAKIKYEVMIQAGKWANQSRESAQLLAMETELNVLRAMNPMGKRTVHSNKPTAKFQKNKSIEWRHQGPKATEPHSRMINSKEYHWCPNHEAWVRHHPSECKGKEFRPQGGNPSRPTSSNGAQRDTASQAETVKVENTSQRFNLMQAMAEVETDEEF